MRTATQGDLSPAEMKLLRQLYPQVLTALHRLGSLEREHSARMAFEEFLNRLPMPTVLLRWNLKAIYQNQAGRGFAGVCGKTPGPAETRSFAPRTPCVFRARARKHRRPGLCNPSSGAFAN